MLHLAVYYFFICANLLKKQGGFWWPLAHMYPHDISDCFEVVRKRLGPFSNSLLVRMYALLCISYVSYIMHLQYAKVYSLPAADGALARGSSLEYDILTGQISLVFDCKKSSICCD